MNSSRVTLFARLLLVVLVVILLILFAIGITKDVLQENCSGLIGAKTSCIEQYALMPFVMIGLPVGAVLAGLLLVVSMSDDGKKNKVKKRR